MGFFCPVSRNDDQILDDKAKPNAIGPVQDDGKNLIDHVVEEVKTDENHEDIMSLNLLSTGKQAHPTYNLKD